MFDEGTGDYTKERTTWLKKDLHEISREIERDEEEATDLIHTQ
jgi:hypothetical protein